MEVLLVAAAIHASAVSAGIEVGLRQYGGHTVAEAGTRFLNTAAFEEAVAAIEEAGGGRLTVPPGEWLTTGFALTSNMVLFLERGATIVALSNFTCTNSSGSLAAAGGGGPGAGSSPPSCDRHCMFKGAKCCGVPCVPCASTRRRCSADYWRPRNDSCPSYPTAVKPGDAGSASGVDERHTGYEPLIGAWNASNITVTGDNGTIDGGGPAWWPIRAELVHGRPHLLFFSRSSHIHVSNLTLRSSPFWTVRFWDSGPALTASTLPRRTGPFVELTWGVLEPVPETPKSVPQRVLSYVGHDREHIYNL
jgi:polygalacturonase